MAPNPFPDAMITRPFTPTGIFVLLIDMDFLLHIWKVPSNNFVNLEEKKTLKIQESIHIVEFSSNSKQSCGPFRIYNMIYCDS